MIIAFVNSKGGVGKSTLAGNLVAWLVNNGQRVALVDADVQASSSQWLGEALPELACFRLATVDEILEELPRIASQFDFVIADGPGSQTEVSRALLMWANTCIIPCKASMFEAWALSRNTSFVRQAQQIRKGPPTAIAVLSMVGRDFRLTDDMRAAAASLNMEVASTVVTLRQAYADAPGQASFVFEMGYPARKASLELHHLFCEILPRVDARYPVIRNRKRTERTDFDSQRKEGQ